MTGPAGDGTPPANDGGQGGGGVSLFTQEQVNAIGANERRGAVEKFFKDLGLEPPKSADEVKTTFTNAAEFKKIQDGQLSELERTKGELGTVQAEAAKVPELSTVIERQRIAADMGLKSRYWKFVEGKTEDEIKASVTATLEDLGIDVEGGDGDQGDQGNGERRPPKPVKQQGHGGGNPPAKSMKAGAEAYADRHPKQQ